MKNDGWGEWHPAFDEIRNETSTPLVIVHCSHDRPVAAIHGTTHGPYLVAHHRTGVLRKNERPAVMPSDGLLTDPSLGDLFADCGECRPRRLDKAALLDLARTARANHRVDKVSIAKVSTECV